MVYLNKFEYTVKTGSLPILSFRGRGSGYGLAVRLRVKIDSLRLFNQQPRACMSTDKGRAEGWAEIGREKYLI